MSRTDLETRTTVSLTAQDLHNLNVIRTSPEYHKLLQQKVDAGSSRPVVRSQSSTLHALMVLGMKALEEDVQAEGYRKLAESRSTSEQSLRRSITRERRARRSDS
ncbi:MAG: hypothetical protein Q3965_06265 [Rothia sp. (in: high G+C Gram-positive bacteria)]|nr:hypothetical protein [Rothia sp. (in: high G+C Gram-positive bacteria)]